MNKAQLIDALAERLGDRKVAAAAVAGLVDVVVRTVHLGERVTITGFGVFEKRARAARTARNPRTGQAVTVQQTDVPAFRPGTLFREVVSGTRTLPEDGASSRAQPATSRPPVNPPASANSRPATRVAATTRLTAVQGTPAKVPKAAKTAKVTHAAKVTDAARVAEPPKPATPATKKATKVRKEEPKIATKAPTKAAKKAVTKSAGKKSAAKK